MVTFNLVPNIKNFLVGKICVLSCSYARLDMHRTRKWNNQQHKTRPMQNTTNNYRRVRHNASLHQCINIRWTSCETGLGELRLCSIC